MPAMIAMSPARWLGDYIVDDPEPEQVATGELESLGRSRSVLGPFPEDRRAAFGTDDRIVGMIEHCDSVAQADPQGPARAPFADHDADDRCRDLAHAHQVFSDDRRLTALFGADSGIGPGRVDERDDR